MGKKKSHQLTRKGPGAGDGREKSVSTDTNNEKKLIDPVLESWGELNEEELCTKFDSFISEEIAEEGIQSVRELYLEVSILEKRLEKSISTLKNEHDKIHGEITLFSDVHSKEAEDLSKRKIQKEKLEELSNQLSKNKAVLIEESKRRGEEEQKRKQAVNEQFSKTVQDISRKLEENGELRLKNIEENEQLKTDLRGVLDHYHAVETEFEGKLNDIDKDLAVASEKLVAQEKIYEEVLKLSTEWQDRVTKQTETEAELRAKLKHYADRFDHFQTSISQSSEMFGKYKSEMESLTTALHNVERENADLSAKASASTASLKGVRDEKDRVVAEVEKVKKQSEKLSALMTVLENDIVSKKAEVARRQALLDTADG